MWTKGLRRLQVLSGGGSLLGTWGPWPRQLSPSPSTTHKSCFCSRQCSESCYQGVKEIAVSCLLIFVRQGWSPQITQGVSQVSSARPGLSGPLGRSAPSRGKDLTDLWLTCCSSWSLIPSNHDEGQLETGRGSRAGVPAHGPGPCWSCLTESMSLTFITNLSHRASQM